ncbi:putative nucleotidyltransferase, ribonuclease H [Tanacetum coccineum]|uniref:RNA-directed DNA polymerase n=1 Tax=Tanacetum coccineum TaxID=301880 RepID=A0ABQ4WCI7_9ASTR
MSIQLADRSIKYPIGVCNNLSVKVSKFIFPVDFVVLEMDEDELVPIILGWPFLATARAVIDVHEGKLSLRVGSETVTFNIGKSMKSKHSQDDYLYCADHIAKLVQEQLVDTVDHDRKWTEVEEEEDSNEVQEVSFYPRTKPAEPLEWKAPENRLKPSSIKPPKLELKELPEHLEYAFLQENNQLLVVISSTLSTVEKARLLEVLKSHKGTIAWSIANIKGIDSSFCTHKILMEDEFKPSVSPVQVVPKKGGMIVVKNEKMSSSYKGRSLDGAYVSTIILIALKDQEKTTFTCPYGTFAYIRMSFRLYNAPATFQRCITAIFHELIEDSMEVFMGDFSVFGNSFDHCLKNVENMLKRYEETNLVLNWEKCHFMVKEGFVLGHKVSGAGIEVDKAKFEAISKLPYPTNVKAIRSFLGHAGFYKRFIKDFSQVARPMTQLLVKDAAFNFSEECIQAFDKLKRELTQAPIMIKPNCSLPFEVMCDASDYAVRAVLGQRIDKYFKPIHYAKKTINEAQENYTTTKKELLAVVFAFDKFRQYLVLSKTIVFTDHSAMRYLFTKQDAKPRLIRWIRLLQEFDIKIRDKKVVENLAADHLSRLENPDLGKLTKAEIRDLFLEEQLMADSDTNNEPWYADYVNYLASRVLPFRSTRQEKQKFFSDLRHYFWDEPFLFKQCADRIIRRCVARYEAAQILRQCHSIPSRGHHGIATTARKDFEAGLYWTHIFRDARRLVQVCDACQRADNISLRDETPQKYIQVWKIFDV